MKGKRRRARRSSKQRLPVAAQIVGFTESEEAFFRAGTQLSDTSAADAYEDLETGSERRHGWLRRLFARSSFAA